ncbi:MAG: hypothetical protein AB7E08_04140 [Candidatus Omnitrophota bacterium]
MFWAKEALERIDKGMSIDEVIAFYEKFFPALKTVEKVLGDFPQELVLSEAGKQRLLEKIIKEKEEEKGRALTAEEKALFSGDAYLTALARSGVLSYWAERMVSEGLNESGLREILTARQRALPLVRTYVSPQVDLSDTFVSGVVSLVAERLKQDDFNIVVAVDKEFIEALLGPERSSILKLMFDIARSHTFTDFLLLTEPLSGDDASVERQITELSANQQGFLIALTNRAWRLMHDKGLTQEEAINEINQWLTGIKGLLVSAGLHNKEYVAEIIADYRKMGKWSYYLELLNPVTEEELGQAEFSPTFPDFVARYNYSLDTYLKLLPNYERIPEAKLKELARLWNEVITKPSRSALEKFKELHDAVTGYTARVFVERFVMDKILRGEDVDGLIRVANEVWSNFRIKRASDLEPLILQFGKKPNWSEKDWQTFKVLYERYLGTELFTSQAWVSPVGEEAKALENFLHYYLGSRPGENRMSGLEALRFHQWAVLVDTFGEGATVEEKWESLMRRIVAMRKEIEALMPDYFGRDPSTGETYFDPYNPVHGGVVAYFIEQALFKMFMSQEEATRQRDLLVSQRGWKVGARFDEKGNRITQKTSNPYTKPQEFLSLALNEVLADLRIATILKPYVEKARMAFIDVTRPEMAGILWFHVNTLKDPPRDWEQFSSLGALKLHLEKEANIMLRLAQQGIYLDIFSSEDMGELSYHAKEGGLPGGKSLRLGSLTPENAFTYFAYPQWTKLLGIPDSSYARLNELSPQIKRLIESNPYWRDGLRRSVNGGFGFDYALMLQIKEELNIAYLLQNEVAQFFGVEKIDLNNPQHLAMLWEYTHRTYLRAKEKMQEEIRAGRIANADSERGWSMLVGDTGKNVSAIVLEKYGFDLSSPGWDKTPYRFWIMEMAGAVLPEISYELRVLKAVRPVVEQIEKRTLNLSDNLDRRLLENYKEIALSLGRDLVVTQHGGEIETLGKEAILRKYEKVVRELITKGMTKEEAEEKVLSAYSDKRESLGKTALFEKYAQEVVDSGIRELIRRAGVITGQVAVETPQRETPSVETPTVEPPPPPQIVKPPELPVPVTLPVITLDIERKLKDSWSLTGASLTWTTQYFKELRTKLDREFGELFATRKEKEEFLDKVISELITSLDRMTEDKFSFWLMPDPGHYTKWKTVAPVEEYNEFIQSFVDRFITFLKMDIERKGISRIDLTSIPQRILASENFGYFYVRNVRETRKVRFTEAIEKMKDAVSAPEQQGTRAPVQPSGASVHPSTSAPEQPSGAPVHQDTRVPEYQDTRTPAHQGTRAPESFAFTGRISGGGNYEVGQTSVFRVWNNVDELDSAYISIKDPNGNEVAKLPISIKTVRTNNSYEFTWTKAGTYTARIVGTKGGNTYYSNEVMVMVKNPVRATQTPVTVTVTPTVTTAKQTGQTAPSSTTSGANQSTSAPVHPSTSTRAVDWSGYRAPEINPRISVSQNISQRLSYYQNTSAPVHQSTRTTEPQSAPRVSTVKFWTNNVFNPFLATVRDRQKAFVLTDMTMFALKSLYGSLPAMTEKRAGIWHNEVSPSAPVYPNTRVPVFAPNLVQDWTARVTNYFRMNYYSGCKWEDLIKKAIEEANRFVWERQHLYGI